MKPANLTALDNPGIEPGPGSAGFTILELLVALTISALVIASVSISFMTWVRAQERADLAMERMRARELTMARLRDALSQSYVPFVVVKSDFMTFKGQDLERPGEPFDAVTFVSLAHRTMRRDAKQSELIEMTAYTVADPDLEDGDKCRILRLREGGTINDRFEVEGGMVMDLARNISRFQISYIDNTAAVKTEWNATMTASLPCAVVIWLGAGCGESEQDECLFIPLKLTNAQNCVFEPEQLKEVCNLQRL
jgi:prepilin-type N-terminal cleavage/methylation domain-containing protein